MSKVIYFKEKIKYLIVSSQRIFNSHLKSLELHKMSYMNIFFNFTYQDGYLPSAIWYQKNVQTCKIMLVLSSTVTNNRFQIILIEF